MTEEQILNAIADACGDETLRFQIIIQDNVLYVYINRPAEAKLDYQSLETKIHAAIKEAKASDFREIALYSRVLGEIEPDWQSLPKETTEIDSGKLSAMMEAITDAVEATNSIVDRIEQELLIPESFASNAIYDFEELPTTADDKDSQIDTKTLDSIDNTVGKDLKQYCFIRNQRLLYAVLSPPKENIARLIDEFHLFGEPIQRSQVDILEQYFEDRTMSNLDDFEPEVQSWWTAIVRLDSDRKRQFAIWLSRYCIHPEQTMRTIEEVLQPKTTVEQDPEVATVEQQKSQATQQSQGNTQSKPNLIIGLKTILRKFWSDRQSSKTE